MAVQAQYPSNADFHSRFRNQSRNLLDEIQMLQGRDNINHQLVDSSLGPLIFSNNNNETVFSNPQSELTCVASGSKKRIREEASLMSQTPASFAYPDLYAADHPNRSRMMDSARTSTSGRNTSSSAPVSQDLVSNLYQQSVEIDALVRFQNERLRLGLEQAQARHRRALISVFEQQAFKKLKEKETELGNASRRNAELEEKVRQMSAENQIWFNVAKNNEAIVSSLRMSLEQVLLQSKEGYGDSDGTAYPADDAQSCCFEGREERATVSAGDGRRKCKVCGDRDVSVLVLPCRHLCLCKDCEVKADTCPICHVNKNACLQIFLS